MIGVKRELKQRAKRVKRRLRFYLRKKLKLLPKKKKKKRRENEANHN